MKTTQLNHYPNLSQHLQLIKAEEKEERLDEVYKRALQTLQGILGQMTKEQGKILSSHYKDIVISLVRIMNKGAHAFSNAVIL